MKIKTIVHDDPGEFDAQVNQYLEEGYILGRRDLIAPNTISRVAHYAQLVLLDPEPEPETPDPFEALHTIREACMAVSQHDCAAGMCPLAEWCHQLREGGDPTDWRIPEKEADQ